LNMKRTDLAVEAREMWNESAENTSKLPGVEAQDRETDGFPVTVVKILDENGERELGKPVGTYVTIDFDEYLRREEDAFDRGALVLCDELKKLLNLGEGETVLVVGLGNDAITPDAIGPRAMRQTMATRHLVQQVPEHFGSLRSVSVLETGVLASTGIESAEIVKAVTEKLRPDRVVVVDALASRRLSRVCRTLQLADTGIIPGSGVGNSRAALNRETLGVPVIAVGVPTVVDAGTLAADLAEQVGANALKPEDFSGYGGEMIVTPREIDSRVNDMSKMIGYGINLALQPELSVADVTMFLS